MTGADEDSALQDWRIQLRDLEAGCHFPSIALTSYQPRPNSRASFHAPEIAWTDKFDRATLLLGSWALLQTSYQRSSDVVVGYPQAEKQGSPFPLRIRVDLTQSTCAYLDGVQVAVENFKILPQIPITRLQSEGSEMPLASGFQTVLSIEETSNPDLKLGTAENSSEKALSLQFCLSKEDVDIAARFDEAIITADQVQRIFSQLTHVLRQLQSSLESSGLLTEIDTISDAELRTVSKWNETRYEPIQDLVHQAFSRRAQTMSEAVAVSSWDGELTFARLEELSTRLAYKLSSLSIQPEEVVPIYFEKSLWVPVSALAVMKAGGAGVLIDTTQPIERARTIISQVSARIVLVSAANAERASQFGEMHLLVVNEDMINTLPESGTLPAAVRPHNLLYVSFTSGSTGKPKGAMITHSCFASSIRNQQEALGFVAGQRVYDFASYAFDAAWSNILHSLTSGGCLCIPSEHQRKNSLVESIRNSKATLINATPTVLRHLDPEQLPDLEQVLLGGEAWAEADFVRWIETKRFINTYGPGEGTIKACLIRAYLGMVPNTIGKGKGVTTWIVRTDGSGRLAPIGAVGEIWLEGPQVARGYIADEARTAASFVKRPRWTDESGHHSGSHSNFYRTGDLARYATNGDLVFVSRADSQVKIRGQRTELGEVEHNVEKALSSIGLRAKVVADVFAPKGNKNSVLIAFVKLDEMGDWGKLVGIDDHLAKLVPDYMIPTTYIPLTEFPLTPTGKIFRRILRETWEKKTLEELFAEEAIRVSTYRAPTTASEMLVRDLWAEVVHVDPATISVNDNFFRIGGDSLGAMLLVSAARKRDVVFSVADIFTHPKLSSLAELLGSNDCTASRLFFNNVEAFSLLDGKLTPSEIKFKVAMLCSIAEDGVEDVYPCTPLQAGLLAETVRRPGDNVLTEKWNFRKDVDKERVRSAWERVVQNNSILRTRIVDVAEGGILQVVVKHEKCQIDQDMLPQSFGLGTPLVSYALSDTEFSWSIHHAIYDGWSMQLIMESLSKFYHGEAVLKSPPFCNFIQFCRSQDQDKITKFWANQFDGFNAQRFPVLPSKDYKPRCDRHFKFEFSDIASNSEYTAATRIKLAWAILLSSITNSTESSFGITVSGRQAPVADIERITGPTFATVPLRVKLGKSRTVSDLLQQVQVQAAEMMPFEQVGIQDIRHMTDDCALGCQFQSHMVIQPTEKQGVANSVFDKSAAKNGAKDSNPFKLYAICLDFTLKSNSIGLYASHDSSVLPSTQFQRLMARFENILRQISAPGTHCQSLSSIMTSSSSDLEQVWQWNKDALEPSHRVVHEIFAEVAAKQPQAAAVCAWDGDFTYSQVDALSTKIAHELLRYELGRDGQRIVPLLFEKSKWTSVCQIAVMKANRTSVVLDAKLPDGRLETVMDLMKPGIVLSSVSQTERAQKLSSASSRIIVISDDNVANLQSPNVATLPKVTSDTWLYIVFTSGSSGTPKGAIISHSNFASALKYGQAALQFSASSRTYDFVSYAFDVSWLNVLYTLCAGGCLCVPSQSDMQLALKESVASLRANTVVFTPSTSKLFYGCDLSVVNFGGENLPRDEIDYWKDHAQIIHSYGPSECTPISISHILDPDRSRVVVGTGLGSRAWIVDPEDGQSLVAVGDIGELWLEGPLVGQGVSST